MCLACRGAADSYLRESAAHPNGVEARQQKQLVIEQLRVIDCPPANAISRFRDDMRRGEEDILFCVHVTLKLIRLKRVTLGSSNLFPSGSSAQSHWDLLRVIVSTLISEDSDRPRYALHSWVIVQTATTHTSGMTLPVRWTNPM